MWKGSLTIFQVKLSRREVLKELATTKKRSPEFPNRPRAEGESQQAQAKQREGPRVARAKRLLRRKHPLREARRSGWLRQLKVKRITVMLTRNCSITRLVRSLQRVVADADDVGQARANQQHQLLKSNRSQTPMG